MESFKVICTTHGTGTEHDFQLFKRSKVKLLKQIEILADKGYQGIKRIHTSSHTPIKKKKKQPLSLIEKETALRAARPGGLGATHLYRELAKQRIYVEHVIRSLKIFRILAQPYRNCRRRFGLRFNLIAGLYNCGLNFAIA